MPLATLPHAPRHSPLYDQHVRGFLKFVLVLVILAVIVGGGAWVWAGRQPGPTVEFRQPDKFVGLATELDLMVQAPAGRLSRLDVSVEQNGKSYPVYTLNQPASGAASAGASDKFYVMRPIGKRAIPELQAGAARVVVHASRPVLRGMRQIETDATKDVQVRL